VTAFTGPRITFPHLAKADRVSVQAAYSRCDICGLTKAARGTKTLLPSSPFSPSSSCTTSLRQVTALPMQLKPSFFSSRMTSSAVTSARSAPAAFAKSWRRE
jgi:hypothetical protein